MRAWRLDYESLRQVKPEIIMLSTCLMGQTGPLAQFAGFGNLAAAVSGFFSLTGWPDRPPAGPFSAYTDYVAPRFTAAAILAALEYRDRTGEGQYIDQSQTESALHFLGPAILDYTVNRRVQPAVGNRDPNMAPHGVYPAAGEDRWIAIAISTPVQWASLCTALQQPELLEDERFATVVARRAHHEVLDGMIAAWNQRHTAEEAEQRLQAHDIPASAVLGMYDLATEPQLAHRQHFVELDDPRQETTTVEGSRFKLSRTSAQIDRLAPTLGRDNREVLETILGYSAERIAALAAQGILQ
jgi:benzylsuccinate CoA-transferase BbsF subunit